MKSIEFVDETPQIQNKAVETAKSIASLGKSVGIIAGVNIKERTRETIEDLSETAKIAKDIASFTHSLVGFIVSFSKDEIKEDGIKNFVFGIPGHVKGIKELSERGMDVWEDRESSPRT